MRKYNEEMDKMQQEAVRRMQEMQSRGKPVHTHRQENTEKGQSKEPPEQTVQIHKENENAINTCSNNINSNTNKQPSFFESIFHDKERSLILLLLLLLSTEKTDTSLILALVYLLI